MAQTPEPYHPIRAETLEQARIIAARLCPCVRKSCVGVRWRDAHGVECRARWAELAASQNVGISPPTS